MRFVPLSVGTSMVAPWIASATEIGIKRIRIPAGTQHGTIQRLRGEGPPRPGGKGRGDILYRLEIEVPRELNHDQQQAVKELAKAMNDHNPRERLLREASASSGKVNT